MTQGDVHYAAFNVNTDIYGVSNLSGVHIAAAFPSVTWQILGTDLNPAKGTGGKGRTRIIVFAMEK